MNMVKDVLKMAVKNGYRAYEVSEHDTFGFLITPDDNVLTVNKGDFGGINVTFNYIPSRQTGSGCSCNDEAIYECDMNTLKKLEAEGKSFARELHAKLYANSQAWFNKCYWNGRGLREVVE